MVRTDVSCQERGKLSGLAVAVGIDGIGQDRWSRKIIAIGTDGGGQHCWYQMIVYQSEQTNEVRIAGMEAPGYLVAVRTDRRMQYRLL